jgi:1,4-alpha-glucan branching enzyme
VLSFVRLSKRGEEMILVACNFTPMPRIAYNVGVPREGFWREILNSDASEHGGSGHGNLGGVTSSDEPFHGHPHSVSLTLPPLGIVFLKHEPSGS